MKLTLDFISIERDEKPQIGDDIMYLTNKFWYIDTYKGELIPADVTHWAKIDLDKLK